MGDDRSMIIKDLSDPEIAAKALEIAGWSSSIYKLAEKLREAVQRIKGYDM
jgi:hypothetical protein